MEYAIAAMVIGLIAWAGVALYFRQRRDAPEQTSTATGYLLLGPLFPFVDRYLAKRNYRLAAREIWAFAFLVLFFAGVVLLVTFTGI